MNALNEWYGQLSERDKKIIQIAAPIVALVVLVFGLIIPINAAVSDLQKEVDANKKAVVILQAESPQGQAGQGKKSFSSLTNLVTNTSRQSNFKLDRFEEKNDGEISVWFDSISFDKMLNWLATLENEYGVTSSYISISQTSDAGIVRANVRLISEN